MNMSQQSFRQYLQKSSNIFSRKNHTLFDVI